MPSSISLIPAPEIIQKFSPRSLLPLREDTLWQIKTGVVRTLTWLEDGSIVALGLWGAGDIVGQGLSKIDPYQVECLTKVEVAHVSLSSQSMFLNREAALITYIRRTEELFVIRSYKRTDIMLFKLLSWLTKRFGRSVEQGQLIDLRLTHQDIADMLGTTRVTVTRLLNQFEQQGLIERFPLHRIMLKEEELWHYEI